MNVLHATDSYEFGGVVAFGATLLYGDQASDQLKGRDHVLGILIGNDNLLLIASFGLL
ncbi:hypothetical protein D3C80_1736500 [compost metagenome]